MPIRVDRKPFILQPQRPPEGEPRRMFDGETETELNPGMRERAQALGLVMHRPQWGPNTMLAHEATVYAKENGLDNEFHHALAGSYWGTGADLGDLAVLKGIAEGCGLDWAELGPRLETHEYREQVLQQYERAKELGIGGTPTYMVGGELMNGDVSLEDLLAAVQGAASG